MTEKVQAGDTVQVSVNMRGIARKDGGKLHVGQFWLDDPSVNVEILSRAASLLPREPGTWWLDKFDNVWTVDSDGYLLAIAHEGRDQPIDCAPFRQLVLK